MPVLSLVYAGSFSAEDIHPALVKPEGQVVRNLTSHGHYHPVWLLQLIDVHHPFKGELIEIEPVAHVIVCRHGLRVVVDHHTAVPFFPDGVQCIHRAPVEFDGTSDPVRPRAEDNHRTVVMEVFDVIEISVICEVQIIGLCREFCRQSIYLLDTRHNAQ